jgi:hypothetical protein
MRLYGDHKPLIFVATSPGFTSLANEQPLISKLTHNLRNGYGVKHYVWVRESTQKGFPHFHFVVDAAYIDGKQLSLYWSSLFNSDASNSIRLGTKPINGKRKFYVVNSQMSWYMCKYLGKGIGESENSPGTKSLDLNLKKPRSFGVSTTLARLSQPLVFGEEISLSCNGLHNRDFVLSNDQESEFIDKDQHPPKMNPRKYNWTWTGHGNTYIGRPKKWSNKKTFRCRSTG